MVILQPVLDSYANHQNLCTKALRGIISDQNSAFDVSGRPANHLAGHYPNFSSPHSLPVLLLRSASTVVTLIHPISVSWVVSVSFVRAIPN